jgi:4-hydroxy-tetrahydrodipicolinate synthase
MSTNADLRGIVPAVITPFTADGAVDTIALTRHTRYLIDAGVGGLIPGGSTGEFAALSNSERKLVHATVVEAANREVPVVAQTGALTAAEAIGLSRHAEQIGADGVMVVPPFYDPLTFAEIKAYYAEVTAAISLPVMLYHIPSATGQQLTPAQIGELAEIPGISSIKDSSGDAAALIETIEAYGDRLQVCNGSDMLTFFALAAGARASVWGAANIFPELAVELYDAIAVRSDLSAARKTWSRLYPLVAFLETGNYTPRVKAACELVGVSAGLPRRPFLPVSGDDLATLESLLDQAGLITRQ